MAAALCTIEVQDHIATITYNRPAKGNAINGQMRDDINRCWARARDDTDIWVVILTATGAKFCSGADLTGEGNPVGTFGGTYWEMPTINSFESGMEFFKPTIAAVQGPCIGYGVTAAAACDFVVASEKASFSYPEVRIGIPTIVGSIRLPPKIGWASAMELLLIGEDVSAERAREMGLVWKLVPHEELLVEANRLARRLTASAPLAQRVVKEVGWRTMMGQMGWTEAVRFGETMRRLHGSSAADSKEGMRAMKEKRKPVWTGESKL